MFIVENGNGFFTPQPHHHPALWQDQSLSWFPAKNTVKSCTAHPSLNLPQFFPRILFLPQECLIFPAMIIAALVHLFAPEHLLSIYYQSVTNTYFCESVRALEQRWAPRLTGIPLISRIFEISEIFAEFSWSRSQSLWWSVLQNHVMIPTSLV